MVNSSGVSDLLELLELVEAFEPDPWQLVNASKIAEAAASITTCRQRSFGTLMRVSSWQGPRSFRFLQLLQSRHICGQRLAIGQFHRPVAALGIQIIQETCGTTDRKSTRLNSSHLGISYAVF